MSNVTISQPGVGVSITQVDTGAAITLGSPAVPAVTVAVPGSISGPMGPPGPQGPPGFVNTFTFPQEAPQATWTITHGLDRFPAVSVVDSTGYTVEGDVFYVSANQVVLNFAGAFSGVAYLN